MSGKDFLSRVLQMGHSLYEFVRVREAQPNSERPEHAIMTCVVTLTSLMAAVEGAALILSYLSKTYPEYFSDSSHWWEDDETDTRRASRIERSLMKRTWCAQSLEHGTDCAICLNDFQDKETVVQASQRCCNNFFHNECLSMWLKIRSNCPCCRSEILCCSVPKQSVFTPGPIYRNSPLCPRDFP